MHNDAFTVGKLKLFKQRHFNREASRSLLLADILAEVCEKGYANPPFRALSFVQSGSKLLENILQCLQIFVYYVDLPRFFYHYFFMQNLALQNNTKNITFKQ